MQAIFSHTFTFISKWFFFMCYVLYRQQFWASDGLVEQEVITVVTADIKYGVMLSYFILLYDYGRK